MKLTCVLLLPLQIVRIPLHALLSTFSLPHNYNKMGQSNNNSQGIETSGTVINELHIPSKYSPGTIGEWRKIEFGYIRVPQNGADNSYSVCVRLDSPPHLSQLHFKCPKCDCKLYDGGIPKKTFCPCGTIYLRNDEDLVKELDFQGENQSIPFFDVTMVPSISYIPELVSITLGIFEEDLLENLVQYESIQLNHLFTDYLGPFFLKKLRSLGLGDYFSFMDCKFKVLGAYPSFGIVTENTAIKCSEVLVAEPIQRINIRAISPSIITQEIFDSRIRDYFLNRVHHINSEQCLFIENQEYIIEAAEPNNGVVTAETVCFFSVDSLPTVARLTLAPYLTDLPIEYQFILSQSTFEEGILSNFIMPYFQGFRRTLAQGQNIEISGVSFRIMYCEPEHGVSYENTEIRYNGGYVRRYNEILNRSIYRRGIRDYSEEEMSFVYEFEGLTPELLGASQEAINMLPIHKVMEITAELIEGVCIVCMCEYACEEYLRTLPCNHMYHSTCIDGWLVINSKCPICKKPIN